MSDRFSEDRQRLEELGERIGSLRGQHLKRTDGQHPEDEPKYDIIIHPGSGSPKKNWPMEHFAAVADAIKSSGHQVSWIRGPAEEDLDYPVDAEMVKADGLMDLAKRLAATNFYIGNDSGITHLAATVGCRTVAVFGPTNPVVWAPRGDEVCVISDNPWPIKEAVQEAFGIATY